MKKYFDLAAVTLGSSGELSGTQSSLDVLSDREIELVSGASDGLSENKGCTNSANCNSSLNSLCTNTSICGGAVNSGRCTDQNPM